MSWACCQMVPGQTRETGGKPMSGTSRSVTEDGEWSARERPLAKPHVMPAASSRTVHRSPELSRVL